VQLVEPPHVPGASDAAVTGAIQDKQVAPIALPKAMPIGNYILTQPQRPPYPADGYALAQGIPPVMMAPPAAPNGAAGAHCSAWITV
jgi:hypothetical protein